ncbi:uncharacterized protein [Cicer arietinum]|uniref:Uncharacterized protein LOC101513630 n=1 Tax=Cicer arietinum TaxID=3827 RepID=A0A1S2YM85_CICAR|nr:uncharacterized protein LOC101513630 [Cicer arietinum]
MNLENCHRLSIKNQRTWSKYERLGYDPIVYVNEFVTRMKVTSLKTLWRKIKREKKRRNFKSSSPAFVYDPSSYLQNFDDGYMTEDPDNFSRSFSARFAAPFKNFEKIINVILDDEEILELNDES